MNNCLFMQPRLADVYVNFAPFWKVLLLLLVLLLFADREVSLQRDYVSGKGKGKGNYLLRESQEVECLSEGGEDTQGLSRSWINT